MNVIELRRTGDIGEIILDLPPVNAIGAQLRRGLLNAIVAATEDPEINSIIIRGRDAIFSAGADIREFSAERAQPHLPDICLAIEQCEKPVLAAIRGPCFGGAMEVALACHYRVAAPSARFALPEVTLGLMPGAGGTQRLPRLIPLEAAADFMISGERINGRDAESLGMIDALLPEESFYAGARQFILTTAGPRRTGERHVLGDASFLDDYLDRHATTLRGLVAPASCIMGLKAASELPLVEGLAKERSLFNELTQAPQARAFRYAFFAERTAGRIEGSAPQICLESIRISSLWVSDHVGPAEQTCRNTEPGAAFRSADITTSSEMLDMMRAIASVPSHASNSSEDEVSAAAVASRIAGSDVLIAADADAHRSQVLSIVASSAKPGAVLLLNANRDDVDAALALGSHMPETLAFTILPAAETSLFVEAAACAGTSDKAAATALSSFRKTGATAIFTRPSRGFVSEDLAALFLENIAGLLLDGVSASAIDRALHEFGLPWHVLRRGKLLNALRVRERLTAEAGDILEALAEDDRHGASIDNQRRAPSDSAGLDPVENNCDGNESRADVPTEEIIVRTLYCIVNRAAQLIEAGYLQRPSDIDVMCLSLFGWPRYKGGPLFWADLMGAKAIVAGLQRFCSSRTDFILSPLLIELARINRGFLS